MWLVKAPELSPRTFFRLGPPHPLSTPLNFGSKSAVLTHPVGPSLLALPNGGAVIRGRRPAPYTPTPLDPHPQPSGHKLGSHLSPRSLHSPAWLPHVCLHLPVPLLQGWASYSTVPPQTWKQPECPPRVEQTGAVCTHSHGDVHAGTHTHTHTHTHTQGHPSAMNEGSPPQTALGGGTGGRRSEGRLPVPRYRSPGR